jgi:hypothetical protein
MSVKVAFLQFSEVFGCVLTSKQRRNSIETYLETASKQHRNSGATTFGCKESRFADIRGQVFDGFMTIYIETASKLHRNSIETTSKRHRNADLLVILTTNTLWQPLF